MTSKLTIAKVGGGEIELTGFTGLKGAPMLDQNDNLVELGHRFANGEASQGTFKLLDPIGELPRTDFEYNLPAHKLVTWTEDASGDEIWLSRGRVSTYDGGRGFALAADQVEYDATVDDGNVELRGQAFAASWERPEETGHARLVALQAYTLNGSSSTSPTARATCEVTVSDAHLAPNTNTETMPAKTYPAGTQPQDVVTECADTEGKVYGVVIHHDGGSHLCLEYILEMDHTTYASPIKISDQIDEWDATDLTAPVFEPHWEMGKASVYDGQQLLSGLVSTWGADQSVFSEHADNITDYDRWVDHFSDSESENVEQAIQINVSERTYRQLTHVTHRVSIIMLPEQVHLVTAGMSLQIKATAAIAGQYLGTYQTRRVAEHSFRPRSDGRYWADLNLDRAIRRRAYRGGAGSVSVPGIATCVPGCTDHFTRTVASGLEPSEIDVVLWENPSGGTTNTYFSVDGDEAVIERDPTPPFGQSSYLKTAAPTIPFEFKFLTRWDGVGFGTPSADGFWGVARLIFDTQSGVGTAPYTQPYAYLEWNSYDGTVSDPDDPPDSNRHTILINGSDDGGASWLEFSETYTTPLGIATTQQYVRVRVEDENAYLKVWPFNEAEPAAWTRELPLPHPDIIPNAYSRMSLQMRSGSVGGRGFVDDVRLYIDSFEVIEGFDCETCFITGGPAATPGDTGLAADAGHDHDSVDNGNAAGGDLAGYYPNPTVPHITDSVDAHDAEAISFTPAGTIAATNVQDAIEEVAAEAGSGGLTVEDEGTPLTTSASTLDFVGAGVTATGAGATKTITIPGGGGSTFAGVRARRTANQSISASSETAILFTATDSYDTDAYHDDSSDEERIVIPAGKAGKYLLAANFLIQDMTAATLLYGYIRVNGSNGIVQDWREPNPNNANSIVLSTVYELAEADYVEVLVYHDASVSRNVSEAHFSVTLLGA